MMKKLLLTFGLLLVAEVVAFAQGTLKGTITDAKTNEPLPFVNVVVKQDGKQVHGGSTDLDGVFTIKPLAVGKYDIEVSTVGYNRYVQTGVNVKATGFTVVDVQLNPTATTLEEVVIVEDKEPIIEIGSAEQGARLSSEDIARMPGNSVESIVASVGGVGYNDGGTGTVRGESGMVTQQGNVRKRTGIAPPKEAIAEIQVVLGGTPANVGEAIGGAQIITLKPPTSQFFGVLGWDTYLDYRFFNRLIAYFTGPLAKRKIVQADGSTLETTFLGYRINAQLSYQNSPFYRARGHRYQIVKDDIVSYIEQNPLTYNPMTGAVNYTGETILHKDSFYEITRLGSKNFVDPSRCPDYQTFSGTVEGALTFRFSDYVTLDVSGDFSASHSPNTSLLPLAMPLSAASVSDAMSMSLTLDFQQRFPDAEVTNEDEARASSPIKNVMYNISGSVSRQVGRTYNENFGSSMDDIFKYGYIGKFITEKVPSYELRQFDINGIQQWAYVQTNWSDNVTYVSPNDPENGYVSYNPILANYNEQLFFSEDFADIRDYLFTRDYILGFNGLYNGDLPSSIYGRISNVGVQSTSFSKYRNDFLYLQAKASADIRGHEIELGVQYDQYWTSSYSLNARSLWTLMRQNANRHISQLDLDNPIYRTVGSQIYVDYNRLLDADQQTAFDAAFREYLMSNGFTNTDGSPIDEYTWIDVDRYSPEDFAKAGGINMFTSEELFNSGSPLVSYSGFDHTGNKYNGANWSLDKFFNDANHPLPAFSPIYAAGYVMDKFYFQDLIFNVGVRVDYFNGNQYVMKDPYLLYESYTVADIKANRSLISGGDSYLDYAGDDWVPYVNQVPDDDNPTAPTIVGYRDQDGKWYDAAGNQVSSPSSVNGTAGRPTPYRTPNGQRTMKDNTVSADAFERYTPQIIPQPRIAFSFPIGEKSQFKASFDIIARRPSSNWSASYLGYLYMTQLSSLYGWNGINNPNLKPERNTNYELGFQQALNESMAISASAYYKETRDLIQMVQYAGADPNPNYYSYDNSDFKTTKGITFTYDMRQTKNIRINANYTLQYAEGSGLTANTMTELIREGYTTLKMLNPITDDRRHEFKANVDFRYGMGAKYNGPTFTRIVTDKETGEKRKKEVKLLENFGVNFMAVAQSGRPYTRQLSYSQPTIVGGYNGSRQPWCFFFDLTVDKLWVFNGKHPSNLRLSLTIYNLFDIRNVYSVFPVTGNPTDDGYLTDPESQRTIDSYLDPQAFRDIYSIYLNNAYWLYTTPRTMLLGLRYSF